VLRHVLASGLALGLGCGHAATERECVEIFERSAELELRARSVTDPEEVRRRVAEARAARGDGLVKGCVGKRITDDALRCVRGAESPEALEGCLR
jgi:hypothetical protein